MKIAIILVISIFIGSLFYFYFRDKLNKQNKLLLGILLIIAIVLICIYNYFIDNESKNYNNIITTFERGDDIQCGDITINNKSFTFTNGTLSFMGKEGTKYYYESISIDNCSIK